MIIHMRSDMFMIFLISVKIRICFCHSKLVCNPKMYHANHSKLHLMLTIQTYCYIIILNVILLY